MSETPLEYMKKLQRIYTNDPDGLARAAGLYITRLENAIKEHNARAAAHNAKVDAVPSLDKPPADAPTGLRFLAEWFDAFYGDAGTGEDRVQVDLREWADRFELLERLAKELRHASEHYKNVEIADDYDDDDLSFASAALSLAEAKIDAALGIFPEGASK